jgi:hypothetical protein
MSESEELVGREVDARQAIHDSLRRIRRDLRNAVDPRVWVRLHPWLAMTAAAAAGFVLSDHLGIGPKPAPVQPPGNRSASSGASPAAAHPVHGQPAQNQTAATPGNSWRSIISREILAVMRPLLMAGIAQHLKSTLFADLPPKSPTSQTGEPAQHPPTV